jgi:hypothetical protein
VPVLLITVIATALGALVARSLYAKPPAPPTAIEPSQSSVPMDEQPGSSEVQGTADATAHPLYNTLRPLLQQYFDAINTKDFESWTEVVTAERVEQTKVDKWYDDYRTTHDGSIVIYRIEASGDGNAQVMLQFVSVQDPKNAPSEFPERCIRWNLVWPFAKERGKWKLAAGVASATPQHEAC